MEARTTFNTASGVLKTKAEKTEKGWMRCESVVS